MDLIPPHISEELANIHMDDASHYQTGQVVNAIRAVPTYLVCKNMVAQIASALSAMCEGLKIEDKEVAQGYLDDLHDDMTY